MSARDEIPSSPHLRIEDEKAAYVESLSSDPDWPPDVRAVYDELQNRLFEIGLEARDVVEGCGIHSHGVYSRFRYFTGHGIRAFLVHHRLRLARRLLRHESLTVTQIAFAVGYASSSGFCTTFKRRIGCTPIAYRDWGGGVRVRL